MVLLAVLGCGGLPDDPWWIDALVADSPCYRVDLLDGLDATSTAEAHDLFGCLNRHGHVEAFRPFDAAFDVETRTGDPVGVELARAVGAMSEADADPFALADVLLAAITASEDRQDETTD